MLDTSTRFRRLKLPLLTIASILLLASNAHAFTFLGYRRVPDPTFPNVFIPAPLYWAVPVGPPPLPGLPPVRTLNVTFNTAPGFAVPAVDQPALGSAVMTWANRAPIAANNNLVTFPGGFPAGTPVKVVGGQSYDLESLLLHELGHAIGLGHPNLANRAAAFLARGTASTSGANGRFEVAGLDGIVGNFNDNRGDDRSLHLVDRDNNPFNANNGPIDKSTFFLDGPFATGGFAQTPTREVASAGVAATGFPALANLEAVMVQGQPRLEAQRELTRDDLHGMSYLQSGPNQLLGGAFAADDYVFDLLFNAAGVASAGGAPPAGIQILVNNTGVAPPLGRTVFNRPFASAIVEYEIDPFTGLALGQVDVWLDGPLESFGTQIVFVDITYYDTPGPDVFGIPEPSTLTLCGLGVVGLLGYGWRRRRAPERVGAQRKQVIWIRFTIWRLS